MLSSGSIKQEKRTCFGVDTADTVAAVVANVQFAVSQHQTHRLGLLRRPVFVAFLAGARNGGAHFALAVDAANAVVAGVRHKDQAVVGTGHATKLVKLGFVQRPSAKSGFFCSK